MKQNARLALRQGTLLLANFSASTTSLLQGQWYTEKYVAVKTRNNNLSHQIIPRLILDKVAKFGSFWLNIEKSYKRSKWARALSAPPSGVDKVKSVWTEQKSKPAFFAATFGCQGSNASEPIQWPWPAVTIITVFTIQHGGQSCSDDSRYYR